MSRKEHRFFAVTPKPQPLAIEGLKGNKQTHSQDTQIKTAIHHMSAHEHMSKLTYVMHVKATRASLHLVLIYTKHLTARA